MRRLLVGFFATIGFLTVVLVLAAVLVVVRLKASTPALADKIILSVDLRQSLADGPGETSLLRLFTGEKSDLRDFLDAIEAGGADPRVKGILARVGNDEFAVAEAQQIRDAIAAFRAKGKFAIAFADSFGEFGAGTRPYYLATAFDQIWLQPMGSVGLTGLYSDAVFFKGMFDLLGIAPEFDHRGAYKTAANSLTETKMTPPHREEVEDLLASVAGQVVNGIAQARKLSPDEVRAAIDRGPLLADEALRASLVDHLGYRDDVIAAAHKLAGSDAALVSLSTYLARTKRPNRQGERIALIYGSGLIVRGGGAAGPLSGSAEMAADRVTQAFRDAVRDPKVRAILFRIDSPGGSVIASEFDLARCRVCARTRQAGHRLDGGCRRFRRVLCRGAGRQDRRRAGNLDRIDRRAGRQAGRRRPAQEDRDFHRFGTDRRQRGDVQRDLATSRPWLDPVSRPFSMRRIRVSRITSPPAAT